MITGRRHRIVVLLGTLLALIACLSQGKASAQEAVPEPMKPMGASVSVESDAVNVEGSDHSVRIEFCTS